MQSRISATTDPTLEKLVSGLAKKKSLSKKVVEQMKMGYLADNEEALAFAKKVELADLWGEFQE